jgi:hypothetical protein
VEFDGCRKQSGLFSFTLTPKAWIRKTSAIGLISKPVVMVVPMLTGISHMNSPHGYQWGFTLYFIKEFQRLKDEVHKQLGL